MYFSPNWQNQLLYKLLPSRRLLNELMPLRGLARKLSHLGTDSLDDVVYRDLTRLPEPFSFVTEPAPIVDYPTMPNLYELPEHFGELDGIPSALRSDERAFATPPLPLPEMPLTPTAEIHAAIDDARVLPDPLEPPADDLFPPMFEMPL